MAQRWKGLVDGFRDALAALITARRDADNLETFSGPIEVKTQLHADRSKWGARGIYVLSPSYKPERAGDTTEAYQFTLRFPVLCRSVAMTDQQHANQLDDVVGCVMDTLDANPGLSGLASSAWVDEITEMDIEEGGRPEAYAAAQIVYVGVVSERSSL